MTDCLVRPSADIRTTTTDLSLPEELQLALPTLSGHLRFGAMDIAVAAIIDLALRGRLVATKSRFRQPSGAKLTLVDASPTGSAPLDAAVQAFVARGKPWKVYAAVAGLCAVVSEATTASLVGRGSLTANGTMRDRGSHLEPVDLALRDELMARIDQAPSAEDPRATVLLDILQHSAFGFTPKPGQRRPPVLGDYPENAGITARGALSALYVATGSAV